MVKKPSKFIWYELMTGDVDAAAKFYGAVIGWTVQSSGQPGMDYRLWSIGDEAVGGLMAISADATTQGMRPVWLGYLNVANVDQSIAQLVAAGGAVCMQATDIPNIGRIAMVTDPQGAAIYIMAPIGVGESPAFAPGRPGHGAWHELHTSDWQAAFAFYGTQFGWTKSQAMDMGPMGIYQLFNAGGDAIGGMMNSLNFPKPMWLYYFNVEDINAGKARVQDAGGTILFGPAEVPGGWIVQARDPQGAMFALFGPGKA